jgi:hypothetical protein
LGFVPFLFLLLHWSGWNGGVDLVILSIFIFILPSLDGLMMVSRSCVRLHSFLTGRRPLRSITIMHPMPPKHLCIRTKPNPGPYISQNALIRLLQPRENPQKLDQLISWDDDNVSLRRVRHSEIARPHNTTLPPPTSTGTSTLQGSVSSDVPAVDDDACYVAI